MILVQMKYIFNQIETDLKLFDMEICNVKIWQYIRRSIFDNIIGKSKIIDMVKIDIDRSGLSVLKKFLKSLKYILCKKDALISPFRRKEVLIFNHPRRKLIEGQFWSIYTDYLLQDFEFDYQVIESVYENRKPPKTKNTKYLDFAVGLSYLIRKLIFIKFTKEDIRTLRILEKRIKKDYKIDINIISKVKITLKQRKSYMWMLAKLLDVYQPKLIIEVVGYLIIKMTLNELCKRRNITTIEFQHGLLSSLDLAYDFPMNVKLDVFPDYFFSFGKYWEELTRFPIPKENIKSVGFPYLESELKKYKDEKSEKILFISSWAYGKDLSEFAIEFAKMSSKEICYKLHPREYKIWKKEYRLKTTQNFTIIDHDEIPLYQLFAESSSIIGVYSTALYEGLMSGLNIFIVNLPGYDYMEEVIKMGYATLISNPTELNEELKKLNSNKAKKIDSNYFFKRDSIENQRKEIQKILNKVNNKH